MVQEIRCSSLHRAMNCEGVLSLQHILESEAGQPAKDGTAVSELLTAMIHQRTDTPTIGPVASNGTFLDQDMWFYARDTYAEILRKAEGSLIKSEERIDWITPSGIRVRGQPDMSFYVHHKATLHIDDMKYGYGIVEVKKNWQLLGYGIGEVIKLQQQYGITPEWIELTIHQPRPWHEDGRVRSWRIHRDELVQYYQQICNRMQSLANGGRVLETSKSCKYCEGASTCPALSRSANKAIDTALYEWNEKEMSNEDLARELDILEKASELLELRLKSIQDLATYRMQNGQTIPGRAYEMTYGDRTWKKNVTPESLFALTGKDCTKTEMLSPNQAEKAGVSKKLTAMLTEKSVKGAKVVKKDIVQEAMKVLPKPY